MSVNSDTPVYSIGSAARLLGISVHTMRMYEREGLIVPYKTGGNQRRYSQSDIERVQCIRKAISEEGIGIAGIQGIQSLIPCWKVKKCSQEERRQCPAYAGHTKGCWCYKNESAGCAGNDCRMCEVYQISTDCSRIKNFIISLLKEDDTPVMVGLRP